MKGFKLHLQILTSFIALALSYLRCGNFLVVSAAAEEVFPTPFLSTAESLRNVAIVAADHHGAFDLFKKVFKKRYNSQEEEEKRFRYFVKNIVESLRHLEANPFARFGVNGFSDLSPQEFMMFLSDAACHTQPSSLRNDDRSRVEETHHNIGGDDTNIHPRGGKLSRNKGHHHHHHQNVSILPPSLDWRAYGVAAAPIDENGSGGGGCIRRKYQVEESQWSLGGRALLETIELVVQSSPSSAGVRGGHGHGGFSCGCATKQEYQPALRSDDKVSLSHRGSFAFLSPFPRKDGPSQHFFRQGPSSSSHPHDVCMATKAHMNITDVNNNNNNINTSHFYAGNNDDNEEEEAIKKHVAASGPIAVLVDSRTWRSYTGGVITSCSHEGVDHTALVVGYDDESSPPYWILKNSWGNDWGEAGYIRLERGRGLCMIRRHKQAMVPLPSSNT